MRNCQTDILNLLYVAGRQCTKHEDSACVQKNGYCKGGNGITTCRCQPGVTGVNCETLIGNSFSLIVVTI